MGKQNLNINATVKIRVSIFYTKNTANKWLACIMTALVYNIENIKNAPVGISLNMMLYAIYYHLIKPNSRKIAFLLDYCSHRLRIPFFFFFHMYYVKHYIIMRSSRGHIHRSCIRQHIDHHIRRPHTSCSDVLRCIIHIRQCMTTILSAF